jgi:hypothetical protein
LVAIGGIADIENCRWKVSHRWHNCALIKTSSPQSEWGSWQPKMNGTSIDNAIAPTDAKSPCIVRARLISWVPALYRRGRLPASDCRLMVADLPPHPLIGRFRTKADKGGFWPATACRLMTRSGHRPALNDLRLNPRRPFPPEPVSAGTMPFPSLRSYQTSEQCKTRLTASG